MNLRDLEYLTAVADCLSFSQAAEQCHVSQPTLSAQVKKAEEYLGAKLFERTNKRVMVTKQGEAIIAAARRALREVKEMRALAAQAKDPMAGEFRLGAFPTLAPYYLPGAVPALHAALPRLTLLLVEEKTEALIAQLQQGKLDAALLALPVHASGLDSIPLFDDEFLLATPLNHPLAGASRAKEGILRDYPPLLLEEGHCLREQALEVCALAGAKEGNEFRATSLETLRAMVKAGTGVTLMPRMAMRENEEGIRYIPFVNPPRRSIGLVYRGMTARPELMHKIAEALNKAA